MKASLLYRIVIATVKFYFTIFYRHRVYGLEHFCKGSAIIAPNHLSFLDPPVIAISAPQEVHFLARATLFKPAWFGRFIAAVNTHPVSGNAGDVKVFKEIGAILKEGNKVILFPEGTRSYEDRLGTIKPGIALLLARAECVIIPAYIKGTFEIWGRERRFPKLWGRTACVFGRPIQWSMFSHLEKKQAQQALAVSLTKAIEALRLWYEQGARGSPP